MYWIGGNLPLNHTIAIEVGPQKSAASNRQRVGFAWRPAARRARIDRRSVRFLAQFWTESNNKLFWQNNKMSWKIKQLCLSYKKLVYLHQKINSFRFNKIYLVQRNRFLRIEKYIYIYFLNVTLHWNIISIMLDEFTSSLL